LKRMASIILSGKKILHIITLYLRSAAHRMFMFTGGRSCSSPQDWSTGVLSRFLFSFLFILFLANGSAAQSSVDRQKLRKMEDSLQPLSDSMINAYDAAKRFRSDSSFIRGLVRALKLKHSFHYPF